MNKSLTIKWKLSVIFPQFHITTFRIAEHDNVREVSVCVCSLVASGNSENGVSFVTNRGGVGNVQTGSCSFWKDKKFHSSVEEVQVSLTQVLLWPFICQSFVVQIKSTDKNSLQLWFSLPSNIIKPFLLNDRFHFIK